MKINVLEYLEEAAESFPDKVAFVDERSSITFVALKEEAQKLAMTITKEIKETYPCPIVVAIEKSVDCMIAFFAVVYSGHFYVPVDVSAPSHRNDKIVEKVQPIAIITDEVGSYTSEKYKIPCIPQNKREPDINSEKLMSIRHKHIDTNPLYVIFTSGSTGIPKGVAISHKSTLDYIDWLGDTFPFSETTVFGNQAPAHFDSSVIDVYSPLKHGATTVFIPKILFSKPKQLLDFMDKYSVNSIFWVPTAMNLLLTRKNLVPPSTLHLENVFTGGEVMPVKTLNHWKKFFPHTKFTNVYGPTEIAVVCSYYKIERHFEEEEFLPIGIPCRNSDILILDEKDQLATAGELCVRGTSLALGYYNDPEKTAEAFVQNPLHNRYEEKIYRTGDMVTLNEKKELMFIGRKDNQIKHMGYRIELEEIEQVVTTLPYHKENCVFYDENKKFIVLCIHTHTRMTESEIISDLKESLPLYMIPSRIYLVEEMKYTSSGKINRPAMKSWYETQAE